MTAQSLFTVADLDLMPEDGNRYEVIEGDIFMSRAPSVLHQLAVHVLDKSLGNFVDQNPIGIVLPGPGVIFDEFNGVIPDLVFISSEREAQVAGGERITGSPDLVIEILSPGADNERRDRDIKRRLYSKFGVKEYWIGDLKNRRIEIYRLKDDVLEHAATLGQDEEITKDLLPGFRCSVRSIFRARSAPA
jgi:Uma2 family endonuclease